MRIGTLNIRHGGGTRIRKLLSFIENINCDVLVITEYRHNKAGDELRDGLSVLGYANCVESVVAPRTNGVLLASRVGLRLINRTAGPSGDEHRLVVAEISNVHIVGVYFPQGAAKRVVFDTLSSIVRGFTDTTLVIGDFNTGLPHVDESGNTFACAREFEELSTQVLSDLWRSRHPDNREYSWYSRAGNGFRIDHALGSSTMTAATQQVQYYHECRESGATDHSALVVECST